MKVIYGVEAKNSMANNLIVEKTEEKRKGWYNKIMDAAGDLAVKAAKSACSIALPVIMVAGAAGCYSSYQRYGEGTDTSTDSSADTVVDTGYDTAEDTTEEEPDLPPACPDLEGSTQVRNLIGDYANRALVDRVDNDPLNSDTAYNDFESDISTNANPFADGEGNTLGPSEIFMHRVTGDSFTPLLDQTVTDDSAAKIYTESQGIWIRGDSHFDESFGDVVGDVRFITYTAKFRGDADDFGIPVCTDALLNDYNYCKSGAEDADYAFASEIHRVKIKFLGSDWLVTAMEPPEASEPMHYEYKVYNGGHVKLAKEADGGYYPFHIGDSFTYADYTLLVDNIEEHGGVLQAVISIYGSAGTLLERDIMGSGETKEFSLEGDELILHTWNVHDSILGPLAPISILSEEIMLEDGERLDEDSGRFPDWNVVIGWKDKGAGPNTRADHLRTIAVYADDIADIAGGDTRLLRNEGFAFPYGFGLCYGGLDLTPGRTHLTFKVEAEDLNVAEAAHPDAPSIRVACRVTAPYMSVESSGYMFVEGGYDHEAVVALNGGDCEGLEISPGSLVMKEYMTSDTYMIQEYAFSANVLSLEDSEMNSIDTTYVVWDRGEYFGSANPEPEFVFMILENAGTGSSYGMVDQVMFAYRYGSINLDINDEEANPLFRRDHMLYDWAGPVNDPESTSLLENMITERGSEVGSFTDNRLDYYVANDIIYSVFYIGNTL